MVLTRSSKSTAGCMGHTITGALSVGTRWKGTRMQLPSRTNWEEVQRIASDGVGQKQVDVIN
eukprot:5306000-Ditylum_brightwellii.AAC.1